LQGGSGDGYGFLPTDFESFAGTVKFRNDQIAPILGYGDLVQGAITIKRVYYVEGLNHNLFSVGQFCNADLEVAFRKSTCYIRDLKGIDLLTGSCGTDLYSITLQDTNSPNPICLMAKATSSHAWLWHHRLSYLNFDTINLLSKNDIVVGLPKLKFVKDHLCSSCELGKAKRKSFHTKTTPSSKIRLQLLHMDLCGPMRVASINGKKYVLVIVDDYSRYTWTHFLRSKDETPEVLIELLRLVQRGLHAQVRIVPTDKVTKFLNKTLHAYFASEGIHHQTSVARTPEQNGVLERCNRTLVEAVQTMLSVAKVPLFFWAEAIATSCFTQNRSLEKGDACIFVGYSTKSRAYRVFNKRTTVIVESIHVNFDELPQMASDHVSSNPGPACQRMALEHDSLSPGFQCQENVTQTDRTVAMSNELDLLFSLMFDELLNGSSQKWLKNMLKLKMTSLSTSSVHRYKTEGIHRLDMLIRQIYIHSINITLLNMSGSDLESINESSSRCYAGLEEFTNEPAVETLNAKTSEDVPKVKNVNGEAQLYDKVDGKVVIFDASIKRNLKFKDEGRVNCLPNEVIFEQLTLMSMVKHLDSGNKFLMYPRFVQVFLNNQLGEMANHIRIYVAPHHTKKIFGNMKRVEKEFSRRVTYLIPTMMVQAREDIESVVNEAVNEEMDDNLERATTIATSLDAKCKEAIGNTSAHTRIYKVKKWLLNKRLLLIKSQVNQEQQQQQQFLQRSHKTKAEEQQELNEEEKAKLFMDLLKKRRKFFSVKRAKEKRNKPPTKAQKRSLMCTYLKNMDGWKPRALKNKSFAKIQELFDKAMKRINTFVDFRTKLVEESSSRDNSKREFNESRR
nr:retrovirus-related Pol polyprotein from transposon TNT 1-94 [Tanacetum cinerariifolium]